MKKLTLILFSLVVFGASCSKDNSVQNGFGNSGTGIGGSLARFTITQNHLYIVDANTLSTYSLAAPKQPVKTSDLQIGFDVETIYAFENYLFIGSRNAMYVLSINNPSQPNMVGTASHVRACDPVVANQNWAYVTVRSGSSCGGTVDALMVYDVSNVTYPSMVNQIDLENPYGLALNGNRLYVCDGPSGMVVYNINNPANPIQIKKITGEVFHDLIISGNTMIALLEKGFAIFDLGANDQITLLAKVKE